jgi:hypothetical protein
MIYKVESIQCKVARFVTNNYDPRASVTTLLQDLNCPTLQHRRQLAKLIMMYRITYHLIEIPSITYLISSDDLKLLAVNITICHDLITLVGDA